MKRIKSLVTSNFDSFFVLICLLLINVSFLFTIIEKNNNASFCFKTTFVFLTIWLTIRLFVEFKRKGKKFFLSNFFLQLTLLAFLSVLTFLCITLPALKSNSLNFDYFVKYICLIYTFLFFILLLNADLKISFIRVYVVVSIGAAFLFCIAYLFPSFRGIDFAGSLTFNFSNSNTTALVLCTLFLNCVYGLVVLRNRFIKTLVFIVSIFLIVLLFLTHARNYIFAFIFALVFLLLFRLRKNKINRLFLSLLIVSTLLLYVCIYVIILYAWSGGAIAESVTISFFGKEITSRYEMWIKGLKAIRSFPFNGFYYELNGQLQWHNAILDLFASYGIVSGVLLSSLFVYLLFLFFKKISFLTLSQWVGLYAFLVILFEGLFEASIFSSPQGLYILSFSFVAYSLKPLSSDLVVESNAAVFGYYSSDPVDVLILNSVYKKGSTGKIVETLYSGLVKQSKKVIVLYGRKEISEKELNVVKCTSFFETLICRALNIFTRDQSLLYFFSTRNVIRTIKKYRPQVVHIHNLNDYYINQYKLFKFLKTNNIRTVLTLHSENLYVGCQKAHVYDCMKWCAGNDCSNCEIKRQRQNNKRIWNRLNKMFTDFPTLSVVCVSPWLTSRASKSSFFSKYKPVTILNGINESFAFTNSISNLIPSVYQKKKKVLFVSANHRDPNKGYKFFCELAKMFEKEDCIFVTLSLDCPLSAASNNIVSLPPIKDHKVLAALYNECDVSIVLSKRETYSMPVAESLCCGTPVCGFKCGGAESIALKDYSAFVEYSNLFDLKKEIETVLNKAYDKKTISKNAILKYSDDGMVTNYLSVYNLKERKSFVRNFKDKNCYFEISI